MFKDLLLQNAIDICSVLALPQTLCLLLYLHKTFMNLPRRGSRARSTISDLRSRRGYHITAGRVTHISHGSRSCLPIPASHPSPLPLSPVPQPPPWQPHQCQCAAHNSSSKLITHQGLWRLSFKTRPGSLLPASSKLRASKWLLQPGRGTLNVAGLVAGGRHRWGNRPQLRFNLRFLQINSI